ncbi:hypothetical protein ILUMI_16488, partial [Ignelater luminosus]
KQCKIKSEILNKQCDSQQGDPSSETNLPSSAVGLATSSTSKNNANSTLIGSTLETASTTISTKHPSTDSSFDHKENKARRNDGTKDSMQPFFSKYTKRHKRTITI